MRASMAISGGLTMLKGGIGPAVTVAMTFTVTMLSHHPMARDPAMPKNISFPATSRHVSKPTKGEHDTGHDQQAKREGCQWRQTFTHAAGKVHWDHIYATELFSNYTLRPLHDYVMAQEHVAVAKIRDHLRKVPPRYVVALKTDCLVFQDLPKKFLPAVRELTARKHQDGTPVYRFEECKRLEGEYREPRIEAPYLTCYGPELLAPPEPLSRYFGTCMAVGSKERDQASASTGRSTMHRAPCYLKRTNEMLFIPCCMNKPAAGRDDASLSDDSISRSMVE
ncbi:hypothetical protein AK812_SmicGene19490 [Symbiodinium microadriaticum]|uniref:Uncharacterized protein n=1 Tax=Symbiodinium microadriaticum TaxID=2951 RepID=A0A1Q9DSE8_SYMMI|nr:hypothetical protein AK812_SmicGene19490 [Symbiodinium microadriaticum]